MSSYFWSSTSSTDPTLGANWTKSDGTTGVAPANGDDVTIAAIPGVAVVATRVVADVTLDVPGMAEPATGRLISLPERGRPPLNDVYLRRGRWVDPSRPDEVLASEMFSEAHGFHPGDRVAADLEFAKVAPEKLDLAIEAREIRYIARA